MLGRGLVKQQSSYQAIEEEDRKTKFNIAFHSL
jgi:hypothetical protein